VVFSVKSKPGDILADLNSNIQAKARDRRVNMLREDREIKRDWKNLPQLFTPDRQWSEWQYYPRESDGDVVVKTTEQNVSVTGDNHMTNDNLPHPNDRSLLRYPNLECPNTSAIDERFSIFVQILIKAKYPEQEPIVIQDNPEIPDRLPEIEIVIRACNFEVEGGNIRTVRVDRDKDVHERFVLIPRQSGEQTIGVDFYQNRRYIGTLKHDLQILSYQPSLH
jgi:hypothetical protein